MAEYTDSDVQALADVIADARLRGIVLGCATLARTILDAGWRHRSPEQLLVDERTRILLNVWQCSWQGRLKDVPVDELTTARGLLQQMIGTIDFALTWSAEGNADGHGEEGEGRAAQLTCDPSLPGPLPPIPDSCYPPGAEPLKIRHGLTPPEDDHG